MRVFLTGATGFIGRSFARRLVDRGDDVVALVRPGTGTGLLPEAVRVVRGDLGSWRRSEEGLDDVDAIVHLAAMVRFGRVDEATMALANIRGTRNVLELAKQHRIAKVLHCSSIAVYGDTGNEVADETWVRRSPLSTLYEKTKTRAHRIAVEERGKGLPVTIALPSVVIGPGEGLLREVLRYYLRRRLRYIVAPDRWVSLVHVDDVADGMLLLLDRGKAEDYILTESNHRLRELFAIAEELTGIPPPHREVSLRTALRVARLSEFFDHLRSKPGLLSVEGVRSLGSSRAFTAAKAQALGWEPRPFRERLRTTLAWFAKDMGLSIPKLGR